MKQPTKAPEAREAEQQLMQQLADVIGSLGISNVDPVGEIPATGIHSEKRVTIEGSTIAVHVDCRDKSKHYQYPGESGIIKTIEVEIAGKDGSIAISARKNEEKTTIDVVEMLSGVKNSGVPATRIKLYEALLDGTVREHNDGLDETALAGAIRKLRQFDTARVKKAPSLREESTAIQVAVARMVRSTLA